MIERRRDSFALKAHSVETASYRYIVKMLNAETVKFKRGVTFYRRLQPSLNIVNLRIFGNLYTAKNINKENSAQIWMLISLYVVISNGVAQTA